MKNLNILFVFVAVMFFACNENTSTKETKDKDKTKQEIPEEEASATEEYTDYKGAEVAFVKEDKLYFYYPQKNETKQLEEEKEPVFNCVFDNDAEILYYTVVRDSILCLKKADYGNDKQLKIKDLCSFGINIKKCISDPPDYDKSNLILHSNEYLILEHEFNHEVGFSKNIAYSLQGDKKPEDIVFDEEMHEIDIIEEKNNNLFYKGNNLSKNLNLDSLNISPESPVYFYEFNLSNDSSKLIFVVDRRRRTEVRTYHPYCIADTDGKNQQILNFTSFFKTKPCFIRNRAVFLRETSSTEDSHVILAITNAKDNSISKIGEYVDYYSVREILQTENTGETNNDVLGKGEFYAYFTDPDKENPTNLRKTPGGEIIYKVPVEKRGYFSFTLVECKNKWFKIKGNLESGFGEPSTITLNQECWVHTSVIGAGLMGSIDNPLIREEPDENAEVVAKIKIPSDMTVRFLDMKGDWVKVTCTDIQNNNFKKTGWILSEWICANPLSNCP